MNPCTEIDLTIASSISSYAFGLDTDLEDIIVELDPERHNGMTCGVFFLKHFDTHGNPEWNDDPFYGWGFKFDDPLRRAWNDCQFTEDEATWSKTEETLVAFSSGFENSYDTLPVFFFKDRATFMRLKLYI